MKNKLYWTAGTGTTGHPHAKKMNLDTNLRLFTKINSKWITDLSAKYKVIKLLDDNIGENLGDVLEKSKTIETVKKIRLVVAKS